MADVLCLTFVVGGAVGLVIGVGALLVPSNVRRHFLMASSHWLCLAVLLWHLSCYTATAVATAGITIPSLAQSLGLLTFKQGSTAVSYLLAQLAVAMMLAALSRADLYINDPEHAPSYIATIPTAAELVGPVPTLHESLANYWHHGRRHTDSRTQDTTQPRALNGGSGGAAATAESASPGEDEGGLAPIRTRIGQAAPSGQRPASLVSHHYKPQHVAAPAYFSSCPCELHCKMLKWR